MSMEFMTNRITQDDGEAFRPSRYSLISKNDAIISPYKTYDLFFEIEFHVIQKLGAYEDIGTPEECMRAMEYWKEKHHEQENGEAGRNHAEDRPPRVGED